MAYLDRIFNCSNEESLKAFVNWKTDEYAEQANIENISVTEYLSKEFKLHVYELTLDALVGGRCTTEEAKNYVNKTRDSLMCYLAKVLDGVTGVKEEQANIFGYTHKKLTSNDKLKYVGETDHPSFEPGEVYSIIEISNWFHNGNELGYYLTNKEYSGGDIDYCTFYSMGELSEKFEVVRD